MLFSESTSVDLAGKPPPARPRRARVNTRGFPMKKIALFAAVAAGSLALAACGGEKPAEEATTVAEETAAATDASAAASEDAAAATDAAAAPAEEAK